MTNKVLNQKKAISYLLRDKKPHLLTMKKRGLINNIRVAYYISLVKYVIEGQLTRTKSKNLDKIINRLCKQ